MLSSEITESYKGTIPSNLRRLNPILQRIYAARQVKSPDELDYSLDHLLHFKHLKNIESAALLLAEAIRNKKRILIVGDFDADGATSTALVMKALRQFGAENVHYLIPNRFKYGYGLSKEIVAASKTDLIMTVDNGISSYEGVLVAKQSGIQVLITDHHVAPSILPEADVIVNPQQTGDRFASKYLAGVGVAFYVMLALRECLKQMQWFDTRAMPYPKMAHLLDLVALGTVADMVPLDFNNRILVYQGLQKMRSLKACCGIQAIAEVANCDLSDCTANALGFSIAPRLNAAGRIEDMSLGVACLLSQSKEEASILANQLESLNKKRRAIEQVMQKEASNGLSNLQTFKSQSSICLFDLKWHEGIIGLVAGRIKNKLQKPTIIFAPRQQTAELKGSARSIAGIHIRNLLADIASQYPQLLSQFGGHAAAAGLTLAQKDYKQFVQIFEQYTQKAMRNLNSKGCQTDGILSAEELNLKLALLIRDSGPWGQGFPEPLFEGYFQILSQRIVGERHLQMTLQHPELARPLKAIVFNADLDKWPNLRVGAVRILYRLTVEIWEGRKDIQLQVERLYL